MTASTLALATSGYEVITYDADSGRYVPLLASVAAFRLVGLAGANFTFQDAGKTVYDAAVYADDEEEEPEGIVDLQKVILVSAAPKGSGAVSTPAAVAGDVRALNGSVFYPGDETEAIDIYLPLGIRARKHTVGGISASAALVGI